MHSQSAALLLALLHGSLILSATVRHGGYGPADVRKLGATVRKIPTLFVRDPDDMKHVTSEVNPECKWVLEGEGVATRKYDGTCFAKLEGFGWAARREVKPGKNPPEVFLHVGTDENTGKAVGWEPAHCSPFAKMWREATEGKHHLLPGTYELVGPKINGNPEGFDKHVLIPHGQVAVQLPDGMPLAYDTLRPILLAMHDQGVEGIVWHHPDGRMVKLKGRDFA